MFETTSYVQYIIWVFSIYIYPQWEGSHGNDDFSSGYWVMGESMGTCEIYQTPPRYESRSVHPTTSSGQSLIEQDLPVLKHGWGLYKWSFSMGKIIWKNHQEGISSPVWPEGNPSVKFPRLDCGHRISVCCWSKLLFSDPKTTQLLTSVSPRINILILDHQVFFSNYLDHFAWYPW